MNKAIEIINNHLNISAAQTTKGDELKAWIHDECDGGRCSTYIDASEARKLSKAFAKVAEELERRQPQKSK